MTTFAGDYPDRMRRLVRSTTKSTSTGQEVETFTPGAYLWCNIQIDSGRKQIDYGTDQTGQTATILVRNLPTLSSLDRLYAVEWDETYVIDTIRRGTDNNELICECYRYDTLEV